MSSRIDINCDCCGKKLNIDSCYPANYGIRVESKNYGYNSSGMSYALYMEPELKKSLDFCGFACLEKWLVERREKVGVEKVKPEYFLEPL